MRTKIRWLGIFLFFAATPQFIFKLSAKVLRPVIDVADDIVSTVESLSDT